MVWKGHIMTYIYNGNFMKQLLIDPVILSAVTLTQPFVMVQRPPLWPQSSGLNASPVKTPLSELPFLCLLTAARGRHKTLLSLRHIYFLTMRFSCKVVCHLICLNLLMSQQNVQQWVDKSALMPSLQIHWCFPMYLEVFSKSLHWEVGEPLLKK